MEIVIDREKRITLLKWLKRGVIDSEELDKLTGLKNLNNEDCERLSRLGYCRARTLTKQEAQELWQQLEREY